MSITHAQAHILIQFALDRPLTDEERESLTIHLRSCGDCEEYSRSTQALDASLRSAFMNQAGAVRPHVNIARVLGKQRTFPLKQLVTTCLTAAFLVFSVFQLMRSSGTPASNVTIPAAPIPTPSPQMTSTHFIPAGCDEIRYVIQEGDTMENLLKQFSVSMDELLEGNETLANGVTPGMEITLIRCGTQASSPTHTITAAPVTLTAFTP